MKVKKGTGKLRYCSPLFKSKTDKRKSILETIKLKRFYIVYYKTLLGQLPIGKGQCLQTFEDADKDLQAKIDTLQQDQRKLHSDYNFAEDHILELEQSINELIKDVDTIKESQTHIKQKVQQTKNKVQRTKSLREHLKDLTKELSEDGVDIEKMIDEMAEEMPETNETLKESE